MFPPIAHNAEAWESWMGVNGKYRWVSPSVERLTGYTPNEIMEMPHYASTLIAAEDRELVLAKLRDAAAGTQGPNRGSLEYRCLRKVGSSFWLSLSWERITDAQGVPLGIRTKAMDITDRKMLEDQSRLAAFALNAISQGVIITDANNLIISINDAFCSITGYNKEEIIGGGLKLLHGPETDPLTIEEILSARRNQLEFKGKILNYRKNGTAFWNDISIVPIRDQYGAISGFVTITRDVTQAHNTEIELRETALRALAADRAKQEFLGMISHELRTPLNAIIGFSDLILKEHKLPPDVLDKLRLVLSSGESLLRIVDDILDYSKVEGGGLKLQSLPFSLSDIAWKSVRVVEPEAQAKSLELSVSIEDNVPGTVLGDPDRIQQVLLNLLRNAVRYTERGSVSLAIGLIRDGKGPERIRFSVKDTGVGIPQEFQETIFQAFTQLHSGSSYKPGGIGIGLSISKQLVEKMGSHLLVESQEGKGSLFFFDVVLPSSSSKPPTHRSSEIDLGSLDHSFAKRYPLKIMAVEDNLINLQVLIKMLQHLGYADVISATSGESALAIVHHEKIDLTFMDLHMPGIDGIETTMVIRSLEQKSPDAHAMIIIALTANLTPSVRDQCFDAGMNYYIAKPFNTRSLAEGIALSQQNEKA
jgi:PAS domain S-box-containing protein